LRLGLWSWKGATTITGAGIVMAAGIGVTTAIIIKA
jgi:hypothetical protein